MQRPPRYASARIPPSALILGCLGVAPFAAFTVARLFAPGFFKIAAAYGIVRYGALILSFMGGAQWGLSMIGPRKRAWSEARGFCVSVIPALAGWGSLALAPRAALGVLIGCFALLLAYDLWTIRKGEAPAWYGRLRLGLTAAVVACLAVTALA